MKTDYVDTSSFRCAENIRYKSSVTEYLCSIEWKYFITLTFRYDVSEEKADRLLKTYRNRLLVNVFGRRSKKRFSFVSFLERCCAGRVHYHILIDDPSIITNSYAALNIKELSRVIWTTIDKCAGDPLLTDKSDSEWFKVLDTDADRSMVVSYCLKQLRFNQEAIQWQHFCLYRGCKIPAVRNFNASI